MTLREHIKTAHKNMEFDADVDGENYMQRVFFEVYAVNKRFNGVTFKQCEFTRCYFRNCIFTGCDFTGAAVRDSNFKGSKFSGCTFKYTAFEKTILDESFLDSCSPSEENIARDLMRSLRINYSQIGNNEAANRAASMEVALTGRHLYNAAMSNQSYYRLKYQRWSRVLHAWHYVKWRFLQLVWGNGESVFRVMVTYLFLVSSLPILLPSKAQGISYADGFCASHGLFWGVPASISVPGWYIGILAACRLVLFGLFMSILIKRMSRR